MRKKSRIENIGIEGKGNVVNRHKTMTQKQLASLMDISAAAVVGWGDQGCPRNADKTYDLSRVCAWLRKGEPDISRLPQKIILKILHTTKPTIKEWHEKGMPRNGDGSYDVVGVVNWRLNILREQITKAVESDQLKAATLKKTIAMAGIAEHTLEEKRGILVSLQKVLAGFTERNYLMKDMHHGIEGRLKTAGLPNKFVEKLRSEFDSLHRFLSSDQVTMQLPDWVAQRLRIFIDEINEEIKRRHLAPKPKPPAAVKKSKRVKRKTKAPGPARPAGRGSDKAKLKTVKKSAATKKRKLPGVPLGSHKKKT